MNENNAPQLNQAAVARQSTTNRIGSCGFVLSLLATISIIFTWSLFKYFDGDVPKLLCAIAFLLFVLLGAVGFALGLIGLFWPRRRWSLLAILLGPLNYLLVFTVLNTELQSHM